MRVACAKDGDLKFRFKRKVQICTKGKGISLPEHVYIRADMCAGKETFVSRKAFVSFGLQKNKEKNM